MGRKKFGILTGGGDVPPLNAVIAAAKEAAANKQIELLGFIKGWRGILDNNFIDLAKINIDPSIGGTILKSSRVNLREVQDGSQIVLDNLKKLGVEGLIVIGGEDTLSNCFYLKNLPQILISKTIDNDVGLIPSGKRIKPEDITNYFTLGYPSAVQKISSFVSLGHGLRTTAYSHERLMVVESMGMHAGWLALASGIGHPDFIVVPESPVDYEMFKELVRERYLERKHLIIVVAEGARWKNGASFSADESEKDDFGHPRFRGAAEVLAKRLKEDLKGNFDTRNVNGVNPSYLYRSGAPGEMDLTWANNLGREAIRLLQEGINGPVLLTTQRKDNNFSIGQYPLAPVSGIDAIHRFVDERFYNPSQYAITENGMEYLTAIVPELPAHLDYGIGR